MPSHSRRLAFVAFSVLLAACSNYDFAAARTPNGGWDLAKLAADLESSGEESLRQGAWIPLIHFDFTRFERSDLRMPDGYTLERHTAYGPLFLAGSNEERIFDEALAPVERRSRSWVGWGGLFWNRTGQIETTHGSRIDRIDRVLLIFGSDNVYYSAARREPSTPGSPAPAEVDGT